MPKILVVEDEPNIALGLEDDLRLEGYDVEVLGNGAAASRRAREYAFDLILLDVMLPGMNGFEVCRELRRCHLSTPIILLTARVQEDDRVRGLDLGANDYVAKPFLRRELLARVRNQLRHVQETRDDQKLFDQELRAACDVQQRLLPQCQPVVPGLDYAGLCQPARGVSGDYYDFIPLSRGRVALLVADVCGKGMPAALLGASLHAAIRAFAPAAGLECGEMLAQVNRLLFQNTAPERFVTVFYGVYDAATGTLTYANAGHCPPLLVRNSSCLRLDSLTAPVGLFSTIDPAERSIFLLPDDWLLIASDGISEACNAAGEDFGEGGLLTLLKNTNPIAAAEFCRLAVASACRFADGPAADDMTLIAAHLLSSG
jgi:serine phosphatase RsbU (regulator of sigma subunit)